MEEVSRWLEGCCKAVMKGLRPRFLEEVGLIAQCGRYVLISGG